jgi:SAM-dependent MidA family methyltransferase
MFDIPADWPHPNADDLARSAQLLGVIRDEIDSTGAISFERYMDLALYAPGLGYYSASNEKFGERGDFITAPTLSPVFAQCMARQVAEILSALGGADVLEAGAGNAVLAAELLLALEQLGHLPRRYYILELSAALRAQQRDTLTRLAPQLIQRVQWLDALPTSGFRGVVLGNEVLDAMPVVRFRVSDNGIDELRVAHTESGFALMPNPASEPVQTRVASLGLPTGYESELGFQAEAWVRSVSERIAQGIVLLIDYGFPRAEFFHPQRNRGTLMCHYRHRAHGNPFVLVGLQDITAHIDFTAMAEAAHETGMDVLGYTSQASFLFGCGLIELATPPLDPRAELTRKQAIRTLTAPHEMGELFKVIAFGRGIDIPLRGFSLQDRRARL